MRCSPHETSPSWWQQQPPPRLRQAHISRSTSRLSHRVTATRFSSAGSWPLSRTTPCRRPTTHLVTRRRRRSHALSRAPRRRGLGAARPVRPVSPCFPSYNLGLTARQTFRHRERAPPDHGARTGTRERGRYWYVWRVVQRLGIVYAATTTIRR